MTMMALPANANVAMVVIQTAKVALVGVGLAFGSLQVSPAGLCESVQQCRICFVVTWIYGQR